MSEASNKKPLATINDIRNAREGLRGHLFRLGGKNPEDSDPAHWNEKRPLSESLKYLPTFQGQNLDQLVSRLEPESVILDYGCGDFLRQQKERYDIIYSVQTLWYSPDHFRTLKLAYRGLKKGGILLVDSIFDSTRPLIHQDGTTVIAAELQNILTYLDYEVEVNARRMSDQTLRSFSFAIKKTYNRLKLPFRLVKHPDLSKKPSQRHNTPCFVVSEIEFMKTNTTDKLILMPNTHFKA